MAVDTDEKQRSVSAYKSSHMQMAWTVHPLPRPGARFARPSTMHCRASSIRLLLVWMCTRVTVIPRAVADSLEGDDSGKQLQALLSVAPHG